MKILESRVEWYLDYGNDPKFEILVDKIPRKIIYSHYPELNHSGIYYGENEGFVSFFYHDINDQTGYGGAKFELELDDGTTRIIRGPWSSRAECMPEPCLDVSLTENKNDWTTSIAGSVTRKLMETCLPEGVELFEGRIPTLIGKTPKESKECMKIVLKSAKC